MYKDRFISAIIAAAGKGRRMGADIPKLEIELEGKAIISYTIEIFEKLDFIDEIILVSSKELVESYKKRYKNKKIKIVPGGSRRQDSTYNGLKALDPRSNIVLSHDGARPFLRVEELIRVVDKALDTGAAILAVPATDTIKEVKDYLVVSTPDRSRLYKVQTPQVFETKVLLEAYERFLNIDGLTDDSSFVEKLGRQVAVVEGSYDNIKITTKKDLELGRRILCP